MIDELYAGFCESVPDRLREGARTLAFSLKLAPQGAPWSEVFTHELTLAAPLLVAEAMPEVGRGRVRDATLAHLLGVIDAFGTDRVEDRQIVADDLLLAVLVEVRRARDRALAAVLGTTPLPPAVHLDSGDEASAGAIARERNLLLDGAGVTIEHYEEISAAKQGPGLLGSLALATTAGWSARRVATLGRALRAAFMGLQAHDDVVDWEDDWKRGGAWAVSLARGLDQRRGATPAASGGFVRVRSLVFETGALATLLQRSAWHFHVASRLFEVLGARRLAGWAEMRARVVTDLAHNEAKHAGFAVRAHQLAPWARECLA